MIELQVKAKFSFIIRSLKKDLIKKNKKTKRFLFPHVKAHRVSMCECMKGMSEDYMEDVIET